VTLHGLGPACWRRGAGQTQSCWDRELAVLKLDLLASDRHRQRSARGNLRRPGDGRACDEAPIGDLGVQRVGACRKHGPRVAEELHPFDRAGSGAWMALPLYTPLSLQIETGPAFSPGSHTCGI
jgi:hypothetical protein